MPDTKLYANSYIDPSDNQRRYFLDLEATHKDDASDPNTVLGGIKSTADNAETIAKGATRAMVFDTIADMETWLKTAANKGKLKIGDNLYIKAVDVPDYWVSAVYETATPEGFYYNYSRLEVGTIKLSNVVTTDSDIAANFDSLFCLLNNNSKLIPATTFWGLIVSHFPIIYNHGTLTARNDLNSIGDGFYESVNGDDPANAPTGAANNLFFQITTLDRKDKFQFVFSANEYTNIYYRNYYGGTGFWRPWVKITFTTV